MTNRKRKLKYIRDKNRLRLGGTIYQIVKISIEQIKHTTDVGRAGLAARAILSIYKKYKIFVLPISTDLAQEEDDFINNLATLKIGFKSEHYA